MQCFKLYWAERANIIIETEKSNNNRTDICYEFWSRVSERFHLRFLPECVSCIMQCSGTCKQFKKPFMYQAMSVSLTSERSSSSVIFEEDHSDVSTINVQTFVDAQEWRLYNHVETKRDEITKMFRTARSLSHSQLSTQCHASRRYGFYVWNILFISVSTTGTNNVLYTSRTSLESTWCSCKVSC